MHAKGYLSTGNKKPKTWKRLLLYQDSHNPGTTEFSERFKGYILL